MCSRASRNRATPVEKEGDRHEVGKWEKDPTNNSRRGFRRLRRKTKPAQVDAVRQDGRAGSGDQGAVFFGHGDNARHLAPGGGFKTPPQLQLMPQVPIVAGLTQLLVEIECNVVFHRMAGGRAIGGVLGHLRELQLRDGGPPLAYGFPEGRAEGRDANCSTTSGRPCLARVRPRAPHQHDFHKTLQQFSRGGASVSVKATRIWSHSAAARDVSCVSGPRRRGRAETALGAATSTRVCPAGLRERRHRSHRQSSTRTCAAAAILSARSAIAGSCDPPGKVARHGRRLPGRSMKSSGSHDGQKVQRRQHQRQQPHAGKRNVGNQQHNRQADGLPRNAAADSGASSPGDAW